MKTLGNYIRKVRTKSEAQKKQTVILWMVALTSLIFLIWAVTFSLSIINNQVDEERLQVEVNTLAKTLASADLVSNTVVVSNESNSWVTKVSQIVVESTDSVKEGFWVISRWLHPAN